MEMIIENMRKETREGFLKSVLNGSFNKAEQEWTNLLKKYVGHSNYLGEYKRILEAAKRGESIKDYPKKRKKEFFQMRKTTPTHIKDILQDLEKVISQ
jgi:hypothetical protein